MDPVAQARVRLAAQKLLGAQGDPTAPYRIPDADFDAYAPGPPRTDVRTAILSGVSQSVPGILARPFAERINPEELARVEAFRPDTAAERVIQPAAGLAVEAPTLYAPIESAVGAGLRGLVGRVALRRAAAALGATAIEATPEVYGAAALKGAGLAGKLAMGTARSAATFGLADVARESLRQGIEEGRIDPERLAKTGLHGAVAGAAVGPAGLIGPTALRIPAEAASLATASAAMQGQAPTPEEVLSNTVLFGLMHGTGALVGGAKVVADQAFTVVDAFNRHQRDSRFAAALDDAISQTPPAVLDTISRGLTSDWPREEAARSIGVVDPELDAALQRSREAFDAAQGGSYEDYTRAQAGLLSVEGEINRRLELAVRNWNDARDRAREARGGAPIGMPGRPEETPTVDWTPDIGARRQRLEQEAQGLEAEAIGRTQAGGLSDAQGQEIQRRLRAIRGELAAMPQTPPLPAEDDIAGAAMDRALAAIQAPRPVEPGAPPTPPLALTPEDMPTFIPRESRPEVRRVLREAGLKGARRKKLMSGPQTWSRAAWEYYQATGKLPPGTDVRLPGAGPAGPPPSPPSIPRRPVRGGGTTEPPRPAPARTEAPPERRAQPSPAPRGDLETLIKRAEGLKEPGAKREAYHVARRAFWDEVEKRLAGRDPSFLFDIFTQSPRLTDLRERLQGMEDKFSEAERAAAEKRPPIPRAGEEPPKPTPKEVEEAGKPIAPPGDRWTVDPGAMPGEPAYYLDAEGDIDKSRFAIKEVQPPEGGPSRWVATEAEKGEIAPSRETLAEAARDAEERADQKPSAPPKGGPVLAPQFLEGEPVTHNGRTLLARNGRAAEIWDPVEKKNVRQIVYDLHGQRGAVAYGVPERDLMPASQERESTTAEDSVVKPTTLADLNTLLFGPGGALESKPAPPSPHDILAGDANRIFTKDRYESAKAKLARLAKGQDLGANPFADPELLAALIEIGGFHVERLVRAGARAVADVRAAWMKHVRAEIEKAGGKISDPTLEWLWSSPAVQQAVADVSKGVSDEQAAPSRQPLPPQGPAQGGRGRSETQAPPEGPPGPELPGGARAGAGVRGARPGQGGELPHERPGGPAPSGVPGDRGDALLREDVRLSRDQAVELTPAKRRAANAAAARIVQEKTPEQTTVADGEALRQYTGEGGLGKQEGQGFLWQHYTSYPVVDFIWKKLKAMGWKGKNVLEPAAGVGNFLGFKPEGSSVDAVEIDPTAAEILRRLYPRQNVHAGPFETFKGREGGYDLVIGNPPFFEARGRLKYAEEAKAYREIRALHDFFVAKGIDQLKPGGVLAYVISTGFMDKADSSVRERIAKQADLVAGYRLPSGVFDKNTGFKGAVDVLFFRKRTEGEKPRPADWIKSEPRKEFEGNNVNEYWTRHKDAVLGEHVRALGQMHLNQMGVKGEFTPEVEDRVLRDQARFPEGGGKAPAPKPPKAPEEEPKPKRGAGPPPPAGARIGQHFVTKGKVYVTEPEGTSAAYTGPVPDKVKAAVEMLDVAEKIRQAMVDGEKMKVAVGQKVLRELLGAYSRRAQAEWAKRTRQPKDMAWLDNDTTLTRAMREDPRVYTLRALIKPDGTPSDLATQPTIFTSQYGAKKIDRTDFNTAALEVQRKLGAVNESSFRSIYTGPKVDFDREMAKRPEWNRTPTGWVHDSSYLYGDVRSRIKEAQALGLQRQVDKLRAVLPPQVTPGTWKPNLSAGWLDPEIVEQFGRDVLGTRFYKVRDRYEKAKRGSSQDWQRALWVEGEVFNKPPVGWSWSDLLLARMNAKFFKPIPPKFDQDGNLTSEGVTEKQADALNAAMPEIDRIFDHWLTKKGHKEGLAATFNDRFRSWRQKDYPWEFEVQGFSNSYFHTIHPWQARVANWLFDAGRGINAVKTGGGKTLALILLGQKLRQEGMSQKPLYVVPGRVIHKWIREYLAAFPNAKVLNLADITGEAFSPQRRHARLEQAALNDWDAVFMTYEGFKEVPMSERATQAWFDDKIAELRRELLNAPKEDRKSARNIEKAILSLEEKLAKALDFDRTSTIDFERLGVDSLFIDEAHNFKNLPQASTGLASELNLGGGDAQRAIDLDLKTNWILKQNGDRNVFMATATPTPNSPIEIYSMTSFLAPDVWRSMGIHSLHSFLSTFADVALKETSLMSGERKRKSVIVGFKNFQDLKPIRERLIYMRTQEQMRREFPTYPYREPAAKQDIVSLDPSPAQEALIGKLLREMRQPPPQGMNALAWKGKLLSKARKIAISSMLADPIHYEKENPNEKLAAIADRVAENYHAYEKDPPRLPEDADPDQPPLNGHAIFLDMYGHAGDPPMAQDLYKRLKAALVQRGIPAEKIATISGTENASARQKAAVADAFNAGRIRVVIGNTMSMGEGMDLQRIGTDLYHWDTTWNPDGMTQRNGRMVRQGNPIDEVTVHHFMTRGTTDQFMYGKLAQKQKWGDSLWERDQDYVENEFAKDAGDMSLEDLELSLDPGAHTRLVFEATGDLADAAARFKYDTAELQKADDTIKGIEEEIATREKKIEGYRARRTEPGHEEAFGHAIEQHETALGELRAALAGARRARDVNARLRGESDAKLQAAQEAMGRAEWIRDRVKNDGVSFVTAKAMAALHEARSPIPPGFSVEKLTEEAARQVEATTAPGTPDRKDYVAGALANIEAVRKGESEAIDFMFGDSHVKDLPSQVAMRAAWKKLYGKAPDLRGKERWPRGGQGFGSVGAADPAQMNREARAYRRYLAAEAKRMGLQPGDTIPTEAEVEKRSAARMAAAGIEPPKAARPKKGRPVSPLAETAVPVPKEGLPLSQLEEALLARDGKAEGDSWKRLGQERMDGDEFDKLSRGEKLVHLSRRILSARDPVHLERIVGAQKYHLWTLPKEDQESVAVLVGRRIAEAGINAVPPALRATVEKMDRGEMGGLASGSGLSQGGFTKWVFSLWPSRLNLKGLGIIEGSTGLRASYEAVKREWNLWMHHGDTTLFRTPQGRRIVLNGRDDQIIYGLLDNPEGHPRGIDRPEVTLGQGDTAEKVVPEEWHRNVARALQKILEEFADRQGLSLDRRQKFYATHILDRVLALERATPKDLFQIHTLAKKALEGNYDRDALAAILPRDLTRNKALQLVDMLEGKNRPSTMRALKRRVDTIMGADERKGIPSELWQPYLKERKGGTPYKQSALLMYETYVRYALRKVWLEPAVLAAKPIIESLPRPNTAFGPIMTQRTYAERVIAHVLGHPTPLDQGANALLESLNQATHGKLMNVPVLWRLFKPNLPTRAAQTLTKIQYLRLLGFAADSALTNLTQGVNTFVKFGALRTMQGYLRLMDPRFWKRLHEEHLLREFQSFFAGPSPPWAHPLNIIERVALSPFTMAEFVNRGAAFAAGLEDARARGLSDTDAIKLGLGTVSDYLSSQKPTSRRFREHPAGATADFAFGPPSAADTFYTTPAALEARKNVIETQFGYSPVESAPALGSATGRLAFQFWSYPLQQSAFLFDSIASGIRQGKYAPAMRALALLGATVTAPWWDDLFGVDMHNFWSIWSLFPQDFGPTAKQVYLLWRASAGDPEAPRELKREAYPEGYGFRFVSKARRYGPGAVLPIYTPAEGGGLSRPGHARVAHGVRH